MKDTVFFNEIQLIFIFDEQLVFNEETSSLLDEESWHL